MADPLTLAYIGYGVARARTEEGYLDGIGEWESEDALMQDVIAHADALDAEFERRYGPNGVNPEGCSFVFAYDIAEPFGMQFTKLLVSDEKADAEVLIQQLFNQADPGFKEPIDEVVLVIARYPGMVPELQVWRSRAFDSEEDARTDWNHHLDRSWDGIPNPPTLARFLRVSTETACANDA